MSTNSQQLRELIRLELSFHIPRRNLLPRSFRFPWAVVRPDAIYNAEGLFGPAVNSVSNDKRLTNFAACVIPSSSHPANLWTYLVVGDPSMRAERISQRMLWIIGQEDVSPTIFHRLRNDMHRSIRLLYTVS